MTSKRTSAISSISGAFCLAAAAAALFTAFYAFPAAAETTLQRIQRTGEVRIGYANEAPFAPASPPYGTSLHHELALLTEAGLSPVDALRSATVLAAQYWGLADRGVIAPGQRADLVLVDGDPLQDISAISQITAVWCAGVPVAGISDQTEETR